MSVGPQRGPTMYVSPAVRALRDDPVAGEPVRLMVRYDAPIDEAVEAAVREADGAVEEDLQFGGVAVEVPQERVADLLGALADRELHVGAVETADVSAPGDAGEDVGDPGAD